MSVITWQRVAALLRPFQVRFVWLLLCGAVLLGVAADGADAALREQVESAMRKAAAFYHGRVAARGGYVYYYSVDLQQRWGEGVATAEQIWVQPPGTPAVGLAYLEAYEATGDRFYLDAASDAAEALMYGQLQSGAWTSVIDFDPRGPRVSLYRNGKGRGRNYSTLDDNTSQAAIRLMMRADVAHEFKHQGVHESAQIALDALLQAQFANGAFPQVWAGPVARDKPVLRASFPDYDWRTEGRVKNYWDMYTLNDGLAGTVSDTLIDAHRIYGDDKFKAALARLGDFLVLAQLPEPQPAWAQQYSYEMHPIWARKFEPAAVTGGESQDVLETLLKIYRYTGDSKYLEPIPRALEYLKRSRLSDGQLARYYELRTNKRLYMRRRGKIYSLTYDDADLPAHYGWKIASRLEAIEAEFRALKNGRDEPAKRSPVELERQVRQVLGELDDEGRWVSTYEGERLVGQPKFPLHGRYIASAVFSRNIVLLGDYLKATR